MDLVWKLCRCEEVIMDFCAGKCSTSKACLLIDQYRKLVGRGVDSELLAAAETDLLLAFVFQVRDPESDIIGSGEMKAAAKVPSEEGVAVLVSKNASV